MFLFIPNTDPETLVRVLFVVWCPTKWGEEACIVLGTDQKTCFPLHHTGRECWWEGLLTLSTTHTFVGNPTAQVIDMPYHVVKRSEGGGGGGGDGDGGNKGLGEKRHLQINVLHWQWSDVKVMKVRVVCAFHDYDGRYNEFFYPFDGRYFDGGSLLSLPPSLSLPLSPSISICSGETNTLFVKLRTSQDFGCEKRIVGDIPELGAWDYRRGLVLQTTSWFHFCGKVEWDRALGPRSFAYKLVWIFCDQSTIGWGGNGDELVKWQGGENCTCPVDGEERERGVTILDIYTPFCF
jgi:hypothetical protein